LWVNFPPSKFIIQPLVVIVTILLVKVSILIEARMVATSTVTDIDLSLKERVHNMERGVNGRIEAAFATAKEKGETAFISFVTAGYPTAEGTKSVGMCACCVSLYL
jgi:hypothetical protein